jgi:hypothetical protein
MGDDALRRFAASVRKRSDLRVANPRPNTEISAFPIRFCLRNQARPAIATVPLPLLGRADEVIE